MQAKRHPAVIVGGGIAGCSLAYSLSLRGVKSLLIERDGVARHASGAAAGLLNPSCEFTQPGPAFQFGLAALSHHRALANQLKQDTGMDVSFSRHPSLRLAFNEREAIALRSSLKWQEELRWVERSELVKLEPRVNPAALGGVHAIHEARVSGSYLTAALMRAAVMKGASIRPGKVVGVKKSGDRLTGVVLEDGEIVAGEIFAFALGAWMPQAQAWLNLPLPIEPVRGQIVLLKAKKALRHALFYNGNYVFSQPDHVLLAGSTQEKAGLDSKTTSEGRAFILENLKKMAPGLDQGGVIGMRAGLRPVSPDGLPILGQAPSWRNVYLAAGYGRKGILLGPLLGECLAALMVNAPPAQPLDLFEPRRLLELAQS